ncbi:hypothetical protein C482_16183 [Natrialba chahannaoensis JCM 10990]|uniref:Uncharacterized protein n=1 Tax=Natrialba chahannaoensis JCM 10990 TaxID=1227492 RepID=M0ACL8_9EURY|nr:hypothetical protein [Natrialba chahannaoensis]ELY96131.1 hypothetical protein C482_16183 [Natrialba chahannaoensis JCM 10990]
MADQRADVERHAASLGVVEVFTHRFPLARVDDIADTTIGEPFVDVLRSESVLWRCTRLAVADDLDGDVLADLAVGRSVRGERGIGVRVDVDEARCDDVTRCVDLCFARSEDNTNRSDSAIPNSNIAVEPRGTGSVDKSAVSEKCVKL